MKRTLCVILICVFILLPGCSQTARKTVFAMDTVMDLQLWGPGSGDALRAVEAMIVETEQKWSAHREDTFISALNRCEPVDEPLVDRVLQMWERTGGAFDPRLSALVQLWGFTEETPSVPTDAQIEEARRQKLWDLGGAVKGYAGLQAADYLQTTGVTHGILNLGGNVQTYGDKPDGTPWSIAIQNPAGGDPLGVVSVVGTMAVVTSGDYQRYFEHDGIRYHHVLDPETGKPARSGVTSVTVICRDGLTADCLSTALFVLGLERGSALWRGSDDFEAVFVLESGKIYATEGAALSGCEYEVIAREN